MMHLYFNSFDRPLEEVSYGRFLLAFAKLNLQRALWQHFAFVYMYRLSTWYFQSRIHSILQFRVQNAYCEITSHVDIYVEP